MRSLEKLPTIANVAAGNTVSITLPVGNVYEKIHVYHTNATLAQMKNLSLELNGRKISEWPSADRLVSMSKHYNRPELTGAFTIDFTRPELHDLKQRRFFGLDTGNTQGISTAAIKLDIDAAATGVELVAFAEKSNAVPGVPNFLTKIRRFIVPVSAAGDFDIDNLPRPAGASIAAIHMYMADGVDADLLCDVTKAMLLVNNSNWHDIDAAKAADIQTYYGRTPQTTEASVIDLTLDGDIQHALPLNNTINDMRIRATAASAGQVEVMVEYIDQWGATRF